MNMRELSQEENLELFQLLLFQTLLATKAEEWHGDPTDFINIAIPKKLVNFLGTTSEPDKMLQSVITDLVCRGIASVAKETGSSANIRMMIQNIFQEEAVVH